MDDEQGIEGAVRVARFFPSEASSRRSASAVLTDDFFNALTCQGGVSDGVEAVVCRPPGPSSADWSCRSRTRRSRSPWSGDPTPRRAPLEADGDVSVREEEGPCADSMVHLGRPRPVRDRHAGCLDSAGRCFRRAACGRGLGRNCDFSRGGRGSTRPRMRGRGVCVVSRRRWSPGFAEGGYGPVPTLGDHRGDDPLREARAGAPPARIRLPWRGTVRSQLSTKARMSALRTSGCVDSIPWG